MIARVDALAAPARVFQAVGDAAIDRIARWLLVAVAVDLVLTRFVVRLAIFVPKGEPWPAVGAALGRVAAVVDVLVPVLGVLLLASLLLRAGRGGDRFQQAILVILSLVAVGGFALVHVPPSPASLMALGVATIVVCVGAAIRIVTNAEIPFLARAGLAALALATMLAASGQLASGDIIVGVVGQVSFVAGAMTLGLAGIVGSRSSRRPGLRHVAVAALVAAATVAVGTATPVVFGQLAIWSTGLGSAIPVPLVAVALGIVLLGLPALHRAAPSAAIGAAIVLLAGHGLAASGLVFAGLLGLVVASASHRGG